MDAKEVLEQTKKHHFWILCAVVLITGFVGWYMAVSDLSTKTTAQIQAITSSYSSGNGVVAIPEHPNPEIAKKVDELLDQKKADVYWGWEAQYEKQQGLVVWPDLGPDFNKEAPKLKYPFEKMNKGEEVLSGRVRSIYKTYMSADLPKLADIVESNWSVPVTETLEDAARGTPDAREGKRQLVWWEPDDQFRLVKNHFEPVTKTVPSTLQLAYAQEDYWVLSELLKIIARTNENTAGGMESTIRTLESISLGRTAIPDSGFQLAKVEALPPPVSALASGGGGGRASGPSMMGGMQGMMGGMGGGSPGMPMGAPTGAMGGSGSMPPMGGSPTGTMGNAPGQGGMPMMPGGAQSGGTATASAGGSSAIPAATDDPADNRYVDSNFKPLIAGKVRSALTAVPTTADDAALAVAKRIPVRIRVRMDQKNVPDLLAECANGKLPVEVRQWRINPQGGQQGVTKKSTGRPKKSTNTNGPLQMSNEGSERDMTDSDDVEVTFELYGLVYLYNPANFKQLNLDKAPEKRGAPTAAAPVPGNNPVPVNTAAPGNNAAQGNKST